MRKRDFSEYRYSTTKFISSLKGSKVDFSDPKGGVANLFFAVFQFFDFLPLLMVLCWTADCNGGGCVPSAFASTYETDISLYCGVDYGRIEVSFSPPESEASGTGLREVGSHIFPTAIFRMRKMEFSEY